MSNRAWLLIALTLAATFGSGPRAMAQTPAAQTSAVAAEPAACLVKDAGQFMTSADKSAPYTVSLKHGAIKIGQPFTVEFVVCSPSGAPFDRVAVDATMPAHRHGMNYKPEIVGLGAGRYEARNLLFHMPGAWQFAVSVFAGAKPTHLTLGVNVK